MSNSLSSILKNPVIVIGAPRSGTSFLSQLLSEHSTLAMSIEPRLVWKWGNDGLSDLLSPAHASPEVVNYIRETFEKFVIENGRSRLAEKTPSNSLRMAFVNQVFPDAKFVHIIRHGKDSALSIRSFWENTASGFSQVNPDRLSQRIKEIQLKQLPYYAKEFAVRALSGIGKKGPTGSALWGPRLPGMRGLVKELDILEVACLQWRTCVEQACAYGRTLPAERYLELRLEALDKSAIELMLNFLGIDNEPALDAHYRNRFKQDKAGGRRKKASLEDEVMLECWLRPTLDWLGYMD